MTADDDGGEAEIGGSGRDFDGGCCSGISVCCFLPSSSAGSPIRFLKVFHMIMWSEEGCNAWLLSSWTGKKIFWIKLCIFVITTVGRRSLVMEGATK